MKRSVSGGIFAAMGILLLILDSKTALAGAQDGIFLCINSVIPSLFPFLVLSGMLTSAVSGTKSPLLRPMGRLLGIPHGFEGIFLTGIVGGYPVGAQSVHNAWKDGQLSKKEASRMLAFCSNAGPAFLFGILGTKFTQGWMIWALWLIHILSAIGVAVLLPGKSKESRSVRPCSPVPLTRSLRQAVGTMGMICGWVVLFRVILAFLDRWVLWLLPVSARVAVYGLLELTNGCCSLDAVASEGLRFILGSAMLAFGGSCVALQTASVTGELGMGRYLPGKGLQTFLSTFLSAAVQILFFPAADKLQISPLILLIPAILLPVFWLIRRKTEKRGSIPAAVGV